ncbi:tyrosine-type recombinase/integrase [Fuerstiella marisgermanici]|uniref:Site-specific tyrosine recombinase n=1 Tax=Fuerstiella marisgermanici TaxID=1891926 RepID=A0A1P8WP70_9PLAN|nr:site-specific integrase [Fuerstiella marisgermanici]APZ95845.1 site-specific tyrosine recombinase [Fuerstiella marisgermanici]
MARQPKPYFRKAQNRWVCTIDGRRITLGKDKAAAKQKFHGLMLDRRNVTSEIVTIYDLSQIYLDWCEANRSAGTYKNHRRYLKGFIESIGRTVRIAALKKHQVLKWSETKGTSTSQNDAISVVKRMFNWAIEQEYLEANPLHGIKKPPRRRRDIVYTPQQWRHIREHATEPFLSLIDFIWSTGCRPREARTIEARHIHGDTAIFPGDEAKGESTRVIFLIPQAKEILDRNTREDGPLFLNTRGNPWTKDSIKCRLNRISKRVGFRCVAYGARHSFATNALINEVDPISISHLMGHKSPRMVGEVYSHLARNPAFLKRQAQKAVVQASSDHLNSTDHVACSD